MAKSKIIEDETIKLIESIKNEKIKLTCTKIYTTAIFKKSEAAIFNAQKRIKAIIEAHKKKEE